MLGILGSPHGMLCDDGDSSQPPRQDPPSYFPYRSKEKAADGTSGCFGNMLMWGRTE